METESKTIPEAEALAEILENTRKTKNYMKWQLIITVALVVIPILAVAIVLPMVLSSLASAYGVEAGTGILQGLQ
jgi:nitrate reductase NapE component